MKIKVALFYFYPSIPNIKKINNIKKSIITAKSSFFPKRHIVVFLPVFLAILHNKKEFFYKIMTIFEKSRLFFAFFYDTMYMDKY